MTSADRLAALVPVPGRGRIFRGRRRVRLGDVTPSGRLRLDALARYLQDVSNDDTRDASLSDAWGWLVRRTTIRVRQSPRLDDVMEFATFCGGTGPRWAERRVRVTTESGADIDAATIWVCVDPATGRPRTLPNDFHRIFAPTAGGRRVSARISHSDPPGAEVAGTTGSSSDPSSSDNPSSDGSTRDSASSDPSSSESSSSDSSTRDSASSDPSSSESSSSDSSTRDRTRDDAAPGTIGVWALSWQVRAADLDVLGHVNNAVSWACVEEVLARSGDADRPLIAEVGFHRAVEFDDPLTLRWCDHGAGRIDLWLTGPDGMHTSALIRPASSRDDRDRSRTEEPLD